MAKEVKKVEVETPKVKTLRVIPGKAELPYRISYRGVDYLFNPDCKIPNTKADGFYADALLRAKRGMFIEAKGKPEFGKYKWSDKYQGEELARIISKLSAEQKSAVYDFIKSLKSGKPTETEKEDEPKPDPADTGDSAGDTARDE